MTFHVSRAKGSILMQASLLKESETAPTLESLIAAVDRLGPTLRARAAEAEGQRQLPAETIRELFDAGVLRFLIPRRFGGHELEWGGHLALGRSEEHTSERQSLMRNSYAVFGLEKKTAQQRT